MTAIEALLAGLIDYAGLYPPAALDMRAAVEKYLSHQRSRHAFALGRFIVDIARLQEFRDTAGEAAGEIRLSVIVPAKFSSAELEDLLHRGFLIESVEIKCDVPHAITRANEQIPRGLERYFEVPIHSSSSGAIDAIALARTRAKLRMGGVIVDAFPAPCDVATLIAFLRDRRVAFKATAGLHHPIRSRHPITSAPDSPIAAMHGFVNLFCAAGVVFAGGSIQDATSVLEEEDSRAFHIQLDSIAWRSYRWSTQEIRTIREEFFAGFGSCSFEEPIHDLEALQWL